MNLGESIYIGGHPSEYNQNSGVTTGLSGAVQKVSNLSRYKGNILRDFKTQIGGLAVHPEGANFYLWWLFQNSGGVTRFTIFQHGLKSRRS